MGLFFILGGGGWSLKTPCKYFIFAIRIHEMVKKWGRKRFYILCSYSCTISYIVKTLLVKLKNLYIQYAWISNMQKQNSNQNVRVKKMVVFVKTFDHYHRNFNFGNFFSSKTVKEFETEILVEIWSWLY